MANFTAADVKKLRELTGAGMMDCKKALDEADGDFDKAVEILRVKGAPRPPSAAPSATATAGLVAAAGGALVELNCETDFVAKSERVHQPLAERDRRRRGAEPRPADVEARSRPSLLDGQTVGEVVERPRPSPSARRSSSAASRTSTATVVAYLHRRAADLPPAVGVLVEYDGDDAEAARGAAHADRRDAPAVPHPRRGPRRRRRAKEREIAEATSREEGKPEQAIAKITEGRLNGFFKDVVLLEQPSVHGEQEDRQGGARRGRRHREAASPASRSARA